MLSLLNSVEHQASQLDRPQHDSSIYGGMLITLALDGYQTMVGLDINWEHLQTARSTLFPACACDAMRSSTSKI